jgi:hypothetical protein
VPTPCEILNRNFYDDGSVISGFCLFIYANEDGQIDGFAEVESSERAVRDVLRFPQPRPGRVGAYLVHVVRKNTNGSEQHDYSYRWAPPGEHIETDKLRVPKLTSTRRTFGNSRALRASGPSRLVTSSLRDH